MYYHLEMITVVYLKRHFNWFKKYGITQMNIMCLNKPRYHCKSYLCIFEYLTIIYVKYTVGRLNIGTLESVFVVGGGLVVQFQISNRVSSMTTKMQKCHC